MPLLSTFSLAPIQSKRQYRAIFQNLQWVFYYFLLSIILTIYLSNSDLLTIIWFTLTLVHIRFISYNSNLSGLARLTPEISPQINPMVYPLYIESRKLHLIIYLNECLRIHYHLTKLLVQELININNIINCYKMSGYIIIEIIIKDLVKITMNLSITIHLKFWNDVS